MWEADALGAAVHDMSNPSPINFTRGVPASDSFPTEDLVAASAAALRSQAETVLQYGPALGFRPLREWLAAWQKTEVDAVLTGNGSLQLVDFLCLHLLSPGDVVFTESPTYDRTITLLRRHGAKIVGIPLEANGPDIASLERALARQVPKLFYVIPDFQNPAGATCSREKRRRIAELARRFGFLLVEDAPYRLLRYRGREEPTLRELAPEQTVHLRHLGALHGLEMTTSGRVFPSGGVACCSSLFQTQPWHPAERSAILASAMGLTVLELEIANPARPAVTERVDLLIDSGAIYSVVPAAILARLGIEPLVEQQFRLANGAKITRKKGGAGFKRGDRGGAADVIFGQEADSALLGATTLEALGLSLDPIRRELEPLPLILAAV